MKLADLQKRYPIFGDVRGKGLMIGVELVENPETRTPLNGAKFMKLWEYCRDAGVILGKGGMYGNVSSLKKPCCTRNIHFLLQVLRIKPPMCITKEDADYTVDTLEEAVKTL